MRGSLRNLLTHLHPLVSYCLMLLMKWTFFGTLGPGDPDTFLNLGKKKKNAHKLLTIQCITRTYASPCM